MHGWSKAKEGEETSSEDLAVTKQPTWIYNMNTNISLNVIQVSNTIRIELNLETLLQRFPYLLSSNEPLDIQRVIENANLEC